MKTKSITNSTQKKTIGKNFKLKNCSKNQLEVKCGENNDENEDISEVIRPQIFTLTLKHTHTQNKQKTQTHNHKKTLKQTEVCQARKKTAQHFLNAIPTDFCVT